MELFFDVETSGFISKKLSASDPGQAWFMQIAFILSEKDRICTEFSTLIRAENRKCHPGAQAVHQISVEECHGFSSAHTLIAHNIFFDLGFVGQYMERNEQDASILNQKSLFCTMKSTTDLCRLPGRYGNFKWPKLTELYKFLFNEEMEGAHDAMVDVRATRRCYYRLKEVL
jgi:DNA polymerase III epsilon subunit-like protein